MSMIKIINAVLKNQKDTFFRKKINDYQRAFKNINGVEKCDIKFNDEDEEYGVRYYVVTLYLKIDNYKRFTVLPEKIKRAVENVNLKGKDAIVDGVKLPDRKYRGISSGDNKMCFDLIVNDK